MTTHILHSAVEEAKRLPDAAQDRLGRELLARVQKLQALRADIAEGLRSLDAGADELNIDTLIDDLHAEHGA